MSTDTMLELMANRCINLLKSLKELKKYNLIYYYEIVSKNEYDIKIKKRKIIKENTYYNKHYIMKATRLQNDKKFQKIIMDFLNKKSIDLASEIKGEVNNDD